MDHDEYINSVKNNLRASYFHSVPSENAVGIDVKKRFLGIPYGEDPEAREVADQFSAFYGESQTSGIFSSDIREIIIINEIPITNVPDDESPVSIIRNQIEYVAAHNKKHIQNEDGKFFVQMLFVAPESTTSMQRVIKNGARVNYPKLAFLPVLANINGGRLTYETEQLDRKGFFARPFIEQIVEFANEYFQVSRE